MHILITGAAGFVGQLLARALLRDTQHTLLLTDVVDPPIPEGGLGNPEEKKRVRTVRADLCSAAADLIVEDDNSNNSNSNSNSNDDDKTLDAVFVFHGIMSSRSEQDFDLGMHTNVDATRGLLEALRRIRPGVRVIYASSQAVYGRPFPDLVDESVRQTPKSSYGAQKLICETMVNEYTRRGFLDGYVLRFPTVAIRPGSPTAAASSFISGMIREPLNGQRSIIPLQDRSFVSWICSPRTLVHNLVHTLTLPSSRLPLHDRAINLPGAGVTIQEMLDALGKVGGQDKLDLVKEIADPTQERILRSWATKFDNAKAYRLGYQPDPGFERAVIDFKESLE